MILEFIFPDERIEVHVDLLDNPGVAHWADKFLNCNYTTNVLCHDHLWMWEMDHARFDRVHRQCQLLISQLAQFGLMYQGPDISTVNHRSLNHVHRFFTHNQQRCNNIEFGDDFDYHSVMRMLDKLNSNVHELERYIARGPEDIAVDKIDEIKLYHSTNYNSDAWCSLADYQQYHSDQHCDIILGPEILGKTLLQSYLDQDDPTDWDTSGHYASAGGLQITYQPIRQQIYQSASFAQWLDRHNADPAVLKYDFPIGNIQDRNTGPFQQVLEQLRHCRFGDVSVNYRKNS
jgi:ssRNA-specific RNase YbeY (16S rRNA maturation enzyme)